VATDIETTLPSHLSRPPANACI